MFWPSTFKEKFGHLNVVKFFNKIDKDDLLWPQETKGIALGMTLRGGIRNLNGHKAIHMGGLFSVNKMRVMILSESSICSV